MFLTDAGDKSKCGLRSTCSKGHKSWVATDGLGPSKEEPVGGKNLWEGKRAGVVVVGCLGLLVEALHKLHVNWCKQFWQSLSQGTWPRSLCSVDECSLTAGLTPVAFTCFSAHEAKGPNRVQFTQTSGSHLLVLMWFCLAQVRPPM